MVSAIVSESFHLDLRKSLEEVLFLDTFGPGTFATPEEIEADEANDAQLYLDMVESIRVWQRNKQLRHHRVKRYLRFVDTSVRPINRFVCH